MAEFSPAGPTVLSAEFLIVQLPLRLMLLLVVVLLLLWLATAGVFGHDADLQVYVSDGMLHCGRGIG